MKLNELKINFDAGNLTEAQAIRGIKPDTWHLLINFKNREKQNELFDSQRETGKVFKNLETIVNMANKIGFKNITIRS